MQQIDGIELLEQLGQGGMGVVYRARHPRLGDVALKLMLGLEAEDRARFLREAEAAGRIRHPHVVPVHLVGESEGRPYLVMRLVEGESLFEHVRRQGPLDELDAVRIGVQLASALHAAHRVGVLHRDLKPGNVFLDRQGDAVLGDFGLALLSDRGRLTQTGEALGSPHYMAPEQACGERDRMGPPTDVYALGATLYHALTGRPPVDAATIAGVLQAVVNQHPAPLRKLRPEIAPELEAICMRCLEKEPGDRYPSAEALERALAAFRERSDPRLRAPQRRRWSRAGWLAGAVLALGGLAAALIVVQAGSQDPRPSPSSPSRVDPRTPTTPAIPAVSTDAEQELVLQPGPLEGQDTFVRDFGWYINDNYGCDPSLVVGTRAKDGQQGYFRTYVRFDLERLPSQAQVDSAILTLSTDGNVLGEVPLTAWFVEPAGGPWTEGTSTHDDYLDGLCARGDVSLPPGTPPTPGLDSDKPEFDEPGYSRGDGVLARCELAAGDDRPTVDLDLTVAVRAWLRGRENLGVCLTGEEGSYVQQRRYFFSSDCPEPAQRPRLTIRYRGPPPAPGRAGAVEAEAEARANAVLAEFEARLGTEEPLTGAEFLDWRGQLSAAAGAAPHRWEPFAARARLFSLADVRSYAPMNALRDLRAALFRAPEQVQPRLRSRVLERLRDILAGHGPRGPDSADAQLSLYRGIRWPELDRFHDENVRRVPQPRPYY